jgi:hypothetical protein
MLRWTLSEIIVSFSLAETKQSIDVLMIVLYTFTMPFHVKNVKVLSSVHQSISPKDLVFRLDRQRETSSCTQHGTKKNPMFVMNTEELASTTQ